MDCDATADAICIIAGIKTWQLLVLFKLFFKKEHHERSGF
jgi:hypothetical protein